MQIHPQYSASLSSKACIHPQPFTSKQPRHAVHRARQLPAVATGHSLPIHGVRRFTTACRLAASPQNAEVVVVGAGLAGLNCTRILQSKGVNALLLEASDGIGGRVRTDNVDGFLLDRGFQIFLTGYPEAKATLDYAALQLKPFYAGSMVRCEGGWHRVADPLRHFTDGVASLPNPVGSIGDKVNVGLFRFKCLLGSVEDIFSRPETTTAQKLKAEGFSNVIIDRFFRPFLGGIFFNRQLTTSSRLFEFVMRMLATGDNCLPAQGIGALAQQLGGQLQQDSILLGTKVDKVVAGGPDSRPKVMLTDGTTLQPAKGVVVAVEGPEARRILGDALQASPSKQEQGVGTCNLYFKAPNPPSNEPILYLNGTDDGIVNNCCFPSTVAPSYAPPGQALVSVSTIGTYDGLSDQQLISTVTKELSQWFGASEVASWTHLQTYRIPFAQPNQTPPTNLSRPVVLGGSLFVCGDHRYAATFDAALVSGRHAAEAVLAQAATQITAVPSVTAVV
eukprot:jgi/Chrzof1/12237/Cz06g26180.t1